MNDLISKTLSGCAALCLVFFSFFFFLFFFFSHNTLTAVQGNTAFHILTDVICYYEIHSEDEHSDKSLHFSVCNALEPLKLPEATRIT